jgi:hypothetical protein
VSYLWCIIRGSLQREQILRNVKNLNDVFLLERGHKGNGVMFFLYGAVCWQLWLNRNDWVFRDRIISSPHLVIYKLLFFMQRWTILSMGGGGIGSDWRSLLRGLGRVWLGAGRWWVLDDGA